MRILNIIKNIIEKLTYNKVYNQGYNINTPINLDLQRIATKALRNGLISYDRRKGWHGIIANKVYTPEWFKDFKKYKLENSIGWKIAIVKKIDKFSVKWDDSASKCFAEYTIRALQGTTETITVSGEAKGFLKTSIDLSLIHISEPTRQEAISYAGLWV